MLSRLRPCAMSESIGCWYGSGSLVDDIAMSAAITRLNTAPLRRCVIAREFDVLGMARIDLAGALEPPVL